MAIYSISEDFIGLVPEAFDPVQVRAALVRKRERLLNEVDKDITCYKAHVASGKMSFTDKVKGGYRIEEDGAGALSREFNEQLNTLQNVQRAIAFLDARRFSQDGTCPKNEPIELDPTQRIQDQVILAMANELNLTEEELNIYAKRTVPATHPSEPPDLVFVQDLRQP